MDHAMMTPGMKLILIACPAGKITKAIAHDGAPTIRLHVSGTKRDVTGDRIADELLDSMCAQAKAGQVMLLENHHSSFPMGQSFDGEVVNEPQGRELYVDFAMDTAHPLTQMVINQIGNGYEAQCSIGLNEKPVTEVRYDPEQGGPTRYLLSGNFEHVAFTRPNDAAYQFAGQPEIKVAKSLSEALRVYKHAGGAMLIPRVANKGGAGSGRYPAGSGGGTAGRSASNDRSTPESRHAQGNLDTAKQELSMREGQLKEAEGRLKAATGANREKAERDVRNAKSWVEGQRDVLRDAESHAFRTNRDANDPGDKSLSKSLIPTVAQKGGAGSGRYPAGSGAALGHEASSAQSAADTANFIATGDSRANGPAKELSRKAADAHRKAAEQHRKEGNEKRAKFHDYTASEYQRYSDSIAGSGPAKSLTKSLIPSVAEKGGAGSGRYPAGSGAAGASDKYPHGHETVASANRAAQANEHAEHASRQAESDNLQTSHGVAADAHREAAEAHRDAAGKANRWGKPELERQAAQHDKDAKYHHTQERIAGQRGKDDLATFGHDSRITDKPSNGGRGEAIPPPPKSKSLIPNVATIHKQRPMAVRRTQ